MRAHIVVFAGHVHNYERHEHGGVTYFVTGGGGAHAYPIERKPDDLFQSKEINYHYIDVKVEPGKMVAVMNRLELKNGVASWSQPDRVSITVSVSRRQPPTQARLRTDVNVCPKAGRSYAIALSRIAFTWICVVSRKGIPSNELSVRIRGSSVPPRTRA